MDKPAFGNSMEPDNRPDLAGDKDRSAGDDRPIQDNGTKNASFSVGGVTHVSKVDYPLPPDPHAPPGPDAGSRGDDEISDFGLNEAVEVAQQGNQLQYGIGGKKD